MSNISTYYAVFLIHLFAVASPGPGFLVATRSSLRGGIRSGIFTALGIAAGDLVLLLISLLGTSALIINYPQVMRSVQVMGAVYLIYIGYKSLRGVLIKKTSTEMSYVSLKGNSQPFKDGFVTTILNPKAIIYFVSLTAQIIRPEQGVLTNFILCALMIGITFFWFSFVSVITGNNSVQKKLLRQQVVIDGILGLLLLMLGIYIIYRV